MSLHSIDLVEEAEEESYRSVLEIRIIETNPTFVTFACVSSVCASEMTINFGLYLHGLIVKYGLEMNSPVAITLLVMYVKFEHLYDPQSFFI